REDAEPLPSKFALWNRWVPSDARRLNLGVFEAVIGSPEALARALQPDADFHSEETFSRAYYDGIYQDRWLGARAAIDLRMPSGSKMVNIRGMAPAGTT